MRFKVTKPSNSIAFSYWLDAFRWLAATVVVFSHAGGQMLVRLGLLSPEDRTFPHFIYSFISGFAHHAVMIFFVMSGFLVGGSLLNEMERKTPDVPVYILKRILRLSIVLIPAMLLTLVLARIGAAIYPSTFGGPYDAKVLQSLSAETFACNAFYLQNALCTRYGGNDSLWSLFHEFWYYMVFPLIALSCFGKSSTSARVGFAAGGAAIILVLTAIQKTNAPIAPYLLIWLMGVAVALWPRRAVLPPIIPALAMIALLVGLRIFGGRSLWSGTTLVSIACDMIVAATFTYLLICLKHSDNLKAPVGAKLHAAMAGFSFSLYCTHLPVSMFYSALMMRLVGRGYDMVPGSLQDWTIVIGGLMSCFVAAYFFWMVTERHTDTVRRAALKLFPPPSGGPPRAAS